MSMTLADLRVEYARAALDEEHADADPLQSIRALVGGGDRRRKCARATR
jgi:hypothetical protein